MNAPPLNLEHAPSRPNWLCSMCLEEWPCTGAKLQLVVTYANDRTALIIYLAERQWEAIDDATLNPRHGIRTINRLRQRFVEWTDAPEYQVVG